jgi:hypothetical protein
MNIIDKTDEEIYLIGNPLWQELINSSNDGNYGAFVKNFSIEFARAMNMVAVNHQFANSELARNLSVEIETIGVIRRGQHVTVLYRQRSTKKDGEWLGRLVIGYENDNVKIFSASII